MTTDGVERKVLELMTECRGLAVPPAELDDMTALTRAGEPGIALENLCEQLFEYDVAVSAALVERIRVLGTAMGLRAEYWTRLRC